MNVSQIELFDDSFKFIHLLYGLKLAWNRLTLSARGQSVDIRFWRVETVPAVKELKYF